MGKAIISKNFVALFILIIAILNWVGNFTGVFYTYVWYDGLLHFMGGAWVAAFVFLWLKPRQKFFDIAKNFTATLVFVLGIVALIGIFWEFFEYSLLREALSLADTLGDLFLNLIGGLALVGIWRVSKQSID